MPAQRPATSIQIVGTPPEFLQAVQDRLHIGNFFFDLAADESNRVADNYFTEEDNALIQLWPTGGWCWLNPPYTNIEPWVQKAYFESREGVQVAMLLPASTGSNWWSRWVANKAYITYLSPRLTFVGHKTAYPKDLVLLLYTPFLEGGSCYWRWK